MDLYIEPDTTITEIVKGRLRWLGHVERMSEERAVKKVFKNILEGEKVRWKTKKRWMDDVENDLMKEGGRKS